VRPRRAPGVLVLLLATAMTATVASPARAQEPSRPPAVAPVAGTPSPVFPLAGAEGAGWMTAPAPALTAPPRAPHVSIAHRWWFWASLGAAAVAVVIAGFTLKPGQPYSGNAGLVSLP
jgi:hypothetical protein